MTIDSDFRYSVKKVDYPKPFTSYASLETTISGTNYDLATNTSLFDNLAVANDVLLRAVGGDVSVRLNESTNDLISIGSGDSITLSNVAINNFFVTASGATLKVLLFGYK